jgi:hypothetical protein
MDQTTGQLEQTDFLITFFTAIIADDSADAVITKQ